MKLLSVFRTSLRAQTRDILLLSLTLIFAPFFVLLYWLWLPSGSTTYGVMVLNDDVSVEMADGSRLEGGSGLIEAFQAVTYANGNPLFRTDRVRDRVEAETRLKNRDAALLVIIPADLSRSILATRQGYKAAATSITFVGDLTNPYYAITAGLASAVLDQFLQVATEQPRPIQVVEEALGGSAARSEFENYVPGLLVFATILLVFQTSMAVAREVEAGTLRRLQLTRMTSLDLLAGISATQVLMSVLAVMLTLLTAWALGFRSQGPLWVAIVVGAVTSLAVVGVGLVIACFAKTVTQAFLIANFPLGLFMFFSGAIYPVPRVPLFTVSGRTIGLYDILPPTHAVVALNKVLTLGAGLGDVVYELTALLVLSALYLAAGVWLFKRRHLRSV